MVLNPSFLLIGSDAKPSIGGGNAKDVEDNAVRMSLREEVSMRSRRCHWPSLPASVRDHDHTGLPSGTWCTPMLTALVNKDLVLHSQVTILEGGISQKRVIVCGCAVLVMVVFVLGSLT